jgi:hypothetical protein
LLAEEIYFLIFLLLRLFSSPSSIHSRSFLGFIAFLPVPHVSTALSPSHRLLLTRAFAELETFFSFSKFGGLETIFFGLFERWNVVLIMKSLNAQL